MICAFIVMKCEGFSMISDLVDYLDNNLLIAHYCGFDISRPLPSYWTFDRFLKNFDNFDRPPKRLSHQFGQSFLFLLHLICYRRSRRIQ